MELPVAGKKRTVDCCARTDGTLTLIRISASKMDEWEDGCPPSTPLPQYNLRKFDQVRKKCSLSRKEPRQHLPGSTTLLQAIKRNITKKASIPSITPLVTNLSSVLLSVLSQTLIYTVHASIINYNNKAYYT